MDTGRPLRSGPTSNRPWIRPHDHRSRLSHNPGAVHPLDLIEYWSIDTDYDGEVFRSVWQDYRGNTENDSDALRVVRTAKLLVPKKEGKRTVCVKSVDVFWWESQVVKDVQ